MTVTIRPQTPADYPAIAALEAAIFNAPITAADVAGQGSEAPFAGLLAERDGQIIGRAIAGEMKRHTPVGDMRCTVVVAEGARRQGVGRLLWDALQPFLVEQQPRHLRANGHDSCPEGVAWAERRGFVSTQHLFSQALDLQAFDRAGCTAKLEPLLAQGFRFVPFAAVQTPANEVRLHDLYQTFLSHTPDSAEAPYMAFAPWRAWALESAEAWPAGWVVALAPGGEWAGFTLMQRHAPGAPGAHIFMTGVAPAYRGQGLATALKVTAAQIAIDAGLTTLTTLNHAANAPILALNRALGFVVRSGIHRLVKRFA